MSLLKQTLLQLLEAKESIKFAIPENVKMDFKVFEAIEDHFLKGEELDIENLTLLDKMMFSDLDKNTPCWNGKKFVPKGVAGYSSDEHVSVFEYFK
jgi:hypothetical protein